MLQFVKMRIVRGLNKKKAEAGRSPHFVQEKNNRDRHLTPRAVATINPPVKTALFVIRMLNALSGRITFPLPLPPQRFEFSPTRKRAKGLFVTTIPSPF